MTERNSVLAKLGLQAPTQLTASDLDHLTPDEIVAAQDAGHLNDLLNGK